MMMIHMMKIFFEYDSIFESGDDEERKINFDLEGQIILAYAFNLGLNQTLATQAYSAWLEPPNVIFTENMKYNIRIEDINGTWSFLEKIPSFSDFAQITLRFLSVPSSEASAERMLYKQLKFITKQRIRTSNTLQLARIAYMSQ